MKQFIQNTIIRRIIYLVIGFLFYTSTGLFNDANAATYRGYNNQYFDNIEDGCNSYLSLSNGNMYHYEPEVLFTYHDAYSNTNPDFTCRFIVTYSSNPAGYGFSVGQIVMPNQTNQVRVFDCVTPSTLNVLTGVCEEPPPPEPCDAGTEVLNQTFRTVDVKSWGSLGCLDGCAYLAAKSPPQRRCAAGSGGSFGYCENFTTVIAKKTGETCSTDTPRPTPTPIPERPESPEFDCLEKGKNFGYYNGVVTCVPKGTPGTEGADEAPNTEEKTTNNPDGTTKKETTKTTQNSDGTIDKETKTETFDSAGNKTGEETKNEKQEFGSFCEENPNSKLCEEGEEGTFSGSCSSSFTCEGDAVQCAIAKEQHKRNCALFEDETARSQNGSDLINGNDHFANPVDIENRDNFDLSTMIDEGSGLGGGTLQDKTIPLLGHNIVLPFSQLNFVFQLLGGFILAISYINAARIVGVR